MMRITEVRMAIRVYNTNYPLDERESQAVASAQLPITEGEQWDLVSKSWNYEDNQHEFVYRLKGE